MKDKKQKIEHGKKQSNIFYGSAGLIINSRSMGWGAIILKNWVKKRYKDMTTGYLSVPYG